VFGRPARLPIDCTLDGVVPPAVPAAIERGERIRRAMDAARSRNEKAQMRQKRLADRHRRLLLLKTGDRVMLSTEGLRMRSGTHKLTARYIGPFAVEGCVNDNAIQLALPPLLSVLHPVINISRLKLYRDGSEEFPTRPQRHAKPPAVEEDTNGVKRFSVECIVAQRKRARHAAEMLVRWEGYGAEHDEWRPRRELLQSAAERVAEFDALQGA